MLMNKWNTIKSLIENKDFEGLQDILHDEYLYLWETTLISKDEMVSFIKKRFEDGLTFEKLELIIENKDLLAWRDVLIEHGGKKWETTNVQLWKDNKVLERCCQRSWFGEGRSHLGIKWNKFHI